MEQILQENKNKQIKEELTNAEKREIKREAKEIIEKQTKENIKTNVVKPTLSFEEKISNFFNKIEFLSLTNEQKEFTAKKIKKDSTGDKLYWIMIFLSSTIAALGLLQNSVAVVIGAMLIAPLLKPINGLGFSIAIGGHRFFIVAFRVLLLSVIFSIIMGFLVVKLIGFNIETSEILARSSPNIIDFFIAIFSAMVAVMSLRFSKLGESVAGVAMAASLMPPLAVVGIELAIGNYQASFGALTLFGANFFAILLVSTIFFWFYGYTPHVEKQQKKMFKRFSFMIILIIIIIIPLISSFYTIRKKIESKKLIRNYLIKTIGSKINNFSISDIEIKKINNNNLNLKTTIKIPENSDLKLIILKINEELSTLFGKTVEIDLEVIRVVKIVSQK